MKTVSSHVDDFLKEYPFLSKFLRQGVINYKALARHIEPEISIAKGEKVGVGAIAVALQRIKLRDQNKLYPLIGRLRGVKVVTGISVFTAGEKMSFEELFTKATQAASSFEDPFILPIGNLLFVEKMIAKELTKSQIASSIKYSALLVSREITAETEVGGISYPLQVLAEHGVLVKAVSATFNEETIVVDESLADKAATVLRHALWR